MLRRIVPSTLAVAFVRNNLAFAKSNVVEATGNNDGEMIDKIEAVWGMKGEPYCAMGQYYVFAKTLAMECGVELTPKTIVKVLQGLRHLVSDQYLTFNPAVGAMIDAARKRRQYREFLRDTTMSKLVPGDLLCFNWAPKGASAKRHIAMVSTIKNGGYIETVEWNTGPDDAVNLDQHDPKLGGGCFIRHRAPDPHFITGYIRWQ